MERPQKRRDVAACDGPDELRSLVDFCASLGGIYEVALGTAAIDPHFVSCGVSICNDVLAERFTATAPTTDEAAAAVLVQIAHAAALSRIEPPSSYA